MDRWCRFKRWIEVDIDGDLPVSQYKDDVQSHSLGVSRIAFVLGCYSIHVPRFKEGLPTCD